MWRKAAPMALVAVLALSSAACGSTSTTPTANGSASVQTSSASQRAEAWVRGTKVTITNSTGADVTLGTATGQGDVVPTIEQTTQTTLANGASTSATEEWDSTNGTDVFVRVAYADGTYGEYRIYNPSIGTPGVEYRTGYSVIRWQYLPGDGETFDENTSQTLTLNGHQTTFSRLGDDGDNKNWTMTINS